MEKKIRVVTIDGGFEGNELFRKRMADSSVVQLIDSFTFTPFLPGNITANNADIFIVDINLPCNISTFIHALKNKIPPAKILISCDFVQPDLLVDCLRAGAKGYIEKYSSQSKFEQTLVDCSENMLLFPLSIAGLLYAQHFIHEADVALKNIYALLSKGFLLNDIIQQTGLSEHQIKRNLFLSLQG